MEIMREKDGLEYYFEVVIDSTKNSPFELGSVKVRHDVRDDMGNLIYKEDQEIELTDKEYRVWQEQQWELFYDNMYCGGHYED